MNLVWTILGVFFALLVHAAILLFGGLLFPKAEENHGTTQEVELLSDDQPDKKEEKKDETTRTEELETEQEDVPDAAEIIRNMELSAVAAAPALEEASLGSIEQALNGQGGGGEFGDALSFASGGRIGGTGKAGSMDEGLEKAFDPNDIDQKPRAVFQASAAYPNELRGKKIEGVVSVLFVVDSSGKVVSPRVEKSTHPAFEKPALDAVKQWKFEPAVKGGQRVGCKMHVNVRFQPNQS